MNDKDCTALCHLAEAAKSLLAARKVAHNGLLSDHCCNALKEVQHAMNCAVNDGLTDD